MEEQQKLLTTRDNDNTNESSLEEWSSDSSSCSSYYSDSDSSIPEWESSIDEKTGQLLFIDCHPFVAQNNADSTENNQELTKSQIRRSTRNKFLRLIRRRESKRRSKRFQTTQENVDVPGSNKVKFQECHEGEEREVTIKFESSNRFKLGRRASIVESVLGLNISTFSDGKRIMIAGFTPDSEAKNLKNIKIGDWLKCINNKEISIENINKILEQIDSNEITLKLQCVAGVEVTKDPPVNELHNQSSFVRQLTSTNIGEEESLLSLLYEHPSSVVFLNTENLRENGPEFEEILYCYPRPFEKNILCKSIGVYITLNHLLNDVTKTKPKISSVTYSGRLCHIVYTQFGTKILLLMLPDNRASSKEIMLINNEIIRLLEFMYGSVERCFDDKNNMGQIDHFFSRFFVHVLCFGLVLKTQQSIGLHSIPNKSLPSQILPKFEELLPAAIFLPLPNEAQMQIDEALTELEASDYREWNEDPLDCQRLFTVLGSALYHSGYLLASHFLHSDLLDVHCYCHQQGLLHLSRTEPVKCLVLWREVFPHSCSDSNSSYKFPPGKRYLLVVGSKKDLLAVLMEAGGCTESPEDNMGPDAFYVEEAQATLSHIQELGIPEVADHCIFNSSGIQVTLPEVPVNKRKTDFLGNLTKSISPNQNKDGPNVGQKKQEVTSILKRRSSDLALSHSSHTYTFSEDNYEINSEDSASQGGYSEKSEVSDEPVLGRRAIRDKINAYASDDSEIDEYGGSSQISSSSYDLSEIRQSLLSETEDLQSLRLTYGNENVLFHYVQVDETEGILLCPPEPKVHSQNLSLILENFRKCCQEIHSVFANTLRFKNMTAPDMAKSVMNKSLIAIKEHGTLFECTLQDDVNQKKSNFKVKFWVIGRLFYMPHPREIYICYQDTVPQNVIEIAFKLGITG